jgi:deoxyribose-phosphate aldolase
MRFDAKTATAESVARYLELFTPDLRSSAECSEWATLAKKYHLRADIVFPQWLPQVAEELAGSDVLVGTGINFPMGVDTPAAKTLAVEEAIRLGANTIDYCMNHRALNSDRVDIVEEELRLFADVAKDVERKVIIEVCYLTDDRIRQASEIVAGLGIEWVKTSTGQYQGPNMEQVAVILDTLKGSNTRCKVSGVKFPRAQNAYAFLMAGVEIIGSQGVVEIIEGLDKLRALGVLPAYEG